MPFFDPSTVDDSQEFSTLPAGNYRVIVEKAETKANRSGNGQLVALRFGVVDGKYAKRKLFDYINIAHANKQAENIGKAQLKRFLAAVGQTAALSSEADFVNAVMNKVLWVKVVVAKDRDGEDQNKIKGYSSGTPAGGEYMPPANQQTKSALDDIPF